jgi:hypothetical protein
MEFLFSIVGHRLTIGLHGVIDTNFKLTGELHKILRDNGNISEIIFVLRKVENLTPEGIKAWTNEIKHLSDKHYTLTFIECPKELIEPLSLKVAKTIKSFVVIYYCSSCNEEYPQLINTNSLTASFDSYVKPNCPSCNKRLTLDFTEDDVERITSLLPIKDSYSDRRKYPRFDVSTYSYKASISRKSDKKSHIFNVVNFSEAGLCVSGHNHFEPGENISIELTIKKHKVVADGNVVWFSKEADSQYLMGVSLTSKEIFNVLIKS